MKFQRKKEISIDQLNATITQTVHTYRITYSSLFFHMLPYIATTGLQARFAKRKCQFRCVLCDGFENAKVCYPIKPRDVVSTESLFGLYISLFSLALFFSIYQTARQCVAPTCMCVSCCYRNQTVGS